MFAGNPLGTPHPPPTTRPGSRATQVGPRSWRSRWVRPAPLHPAEAEAVSTSSGEAAAPAAAAPAEPAAAAPPRAAAPPTAAPQPQPAASGAQGQRAGTAAADSRARPVTRTLLPGELRSLAARSCPQCGGTGSIPSAHGPVPCTACQPWRRRPDYKPEATLINSKDLDLAQLELAPSSSGSSSGGGGSGSASGAASAKRVGRPPKKASSAAAAAAAAAATGSAAAPAAAEAPAKPKVSKWHVMTEEKREAIRRGRANKGPHSEEHRRKIARALREAHAKDPGLRHVTRGAKKTCSYCGSEGHTRRGCAKLKADTAAEQAADGEAAASEGSQRRKRGPQLITEERKRQLRELLRELHAKNPGLRYVGKGKPKTCSYCGGKGHTVRGCERRKMDEAQAAGLPVEEVLSGGKAKASKQRRPPTCGLCGQLGHSKRYCPQLAAAGAAAGAATAAGAASAAAVALPREAPASASAQPAAATPPAAGLVQHALPAAQEFGPSAAASVPSAPAPLVPRGPTSAAAAAPAEEDLRARVQQPAKALGSGAATPAAAAAASAALPAGSPMAGPQVLWQLGAELGPPAQALQEAPASKPAEVLRKGQGPAADGAVAQAAGKQQQQRASLAASGPAATAGEAALAPPKPVQGAAVSAAAVPSAAAGSAAASAVPPAALAAAEQSSSSSSSSAATAAAPAQPAAKSVEEAIAPSAPPPAPVQQPPPTQPPQQQQQQQGRTPRVPATPPAAASTTAAAAANFSSAAASVSYDDAGLPTWELGRSGMLLDPDGGLVFPLPTRQSDSILQAAQAVLRAWEDGVRCQCLELPLPLNNPAALEGGGWPGGIRQQYRVALPILEGLLRRLKMFEGLQGRITAEWLDKADCVGAWQSERLAAVLFPTADTLPAVRRIENALSGRRLMLVVNPQWQVEGQVISDFGFGQARRRAEQFIKSFDDVYCLRRARVRGEEVRILRCYPGTWQVYYVKGAGEEPLLLACEESKPTYQRLEELMQPILARKSSWLQQWLGWAGGGDAAALPAPAPVTAAAPRGTGSSDPTARPLPGSSEARRGATAAAAAGGWAGDRPPSAAAEGPVRAARQQQQRRRQQRIAAASGPSLQSGSSGSMSSAEMSSASLSLDFEEGLGSMNVDALGSMDIDVITGEPVARDYRLQPVQQIAKWVFGEEGGSAAKK